MSKGLWINNLCRDQRKKGFRELLKKERKTKIRRKKSAIEPSKQIIGRISKIIAILTPGIPQ
jgi:hypothetical protein